VTDPRPTQAEVEAMAAAMFGRKWKMFPESLKRQGDRIIADRLDKARAAVLRTRP
jgi:hypothetical protein